MGGPWSKMESGIGDNLGLKSGGKEVKAGVVGREGIGRAWDNSMNERSSISIISFISFVS